MTQTGGRPATTRRNNARTALLADIRGVVAIVRAQEDITDAQKIELGLSVPRQRRNAIAPPDVAPSRQLASVVGHRVQVLLFDQEADRPRRPRDIAGAAIYLHVGEQPSGDPHSWRRMGSATRARHVVKLPTTLPPGTKFWLAAAWYGTRAQVGPTSTPASGWIQFGGPMEMAA